MNVKYPELLDHEWLVSQLQKKTKSELAAERNIPYNAIHNHVRRLPAELRAKISCTRFTWSDEDKLALIKEAETRGFTKVASENGIDRSQLSHWSIELREKGILTTERIERRGRPSKAKAS